MPSTSTGFRPVVYVATNHDWFAYQHFYQGLARAFAASRPVLYVGSVTTGQGELRHVDDGIWLLSVRVPKGAGRRILRPLRDRLVARGIRRALTHLGWSEPPVVWTYTTDAAPFLRQADVATSVYWTGDEVVDPFEGSLLRVVDHVFTVSPAATAAKRALVDPGRVTEMPMAVDPTPYERAAAARRVPDELAARPRPWFGYGGAVNARTDWDLVERLATRTGGTVIIVGPATDDEGRRQMARTDRPANVVFVGHKDPEAAALYIASLDVGLIPYTLSAFNLGSNPVKTYDYLAAGLPVVATALPSITPLQPHVAVASSADEFVTLALAAAAAGTGDDDRRERQAVARTYSYDALVQRVNDVLGDAARLP